MNSNDLITKLSKLKVCRLGDQRAPHKPLLLLLALSRIQQQATHLQKIIRDPKFRGKVLQAYNYRCAICGFDVSMGHTPIAPETAHIKWFQAVGEIPKKMD